MNSNKLNQLVGKLFDEYEDCTHPSDHLVCGQCLRRRRAALEFALESCTGPEPSEEDRSLARGIYVAPMNRDGHHEIDQLARLLARVRQQERERAA